MKRIALSLLLACTVIWVPTSCCSTKPAEPVEPAKEFNSLKHLDKGEATPEEGYFLSEKDWEDLLEIIFELERKVERMRDE